jgi:phosphate starvation-inducible PhoH-like protein
LKIAQEEFTAPRDDNQRLANLCGPLDENLRQIEQALDVTLARRGHRIAVLGRNAKTAVAALENFYNRARVPLSLEDVQLGLVEARHGSDGGATAAKPSGRTARSGGPAKAGAKTKTAAKSRTSVVGRGAARTETERYPTGPDLPPTVELNARDPGAPMAAGAEAHALPTHLGPDAIVLHTRKSDLRGRTPTQHAYLKAILSHDITFGIGPAGTGKTYLAVACAVDALERDQIKRIVLTRPAVEAGERLGFLPGDLTQKVDPYLRPLYDALYDLLGFDRTAKMFEKQMIEIAPLAYMRGRTLNHAFIILDEAQNTTPEQMKMFLTRIGFGSKAVVTGDTTQVDLPRGHRSGLLDAQEVLSEVRGIAMTRFTSVDVVRHPLVGRIVDAYEAHAKLDERDHRDGRGNAPRRAHPGSSPRGTRPEGSAAFADRSPDAGEAATTVPGVLSDAPSPH